MKGRNFFLCIIVFLSVALFASAFNLDMQVVKAEGVYPTYSNVETNRTIAGETSRFSVTCADETDLSHYRFGFNNGSGFNNDTWQTFSTNPETLNIHKKLNDTVGTEIEWQIWFNDTSNNFNNTGLQSFYVDIMASGLTIANINAAIAVVNSTNAEIVYLPAGIQAWDIGDGKTEGLTYGYYAGIYTEDGVSFIGEGNNQTVIYINADAPNGGYGFYINGIPTNGVTTRISNITLIGYINASDPEDEAWKGVQFRCCEDFRVDHCIFRDWASTAIGAKNNVGSGHPKGRGVIDHCNITNPYKDIYGGIWGYGVIFGGNDIDWHETVDYIGNYGSDNNVANVMFVEDCIFNQTRHAVAGADGSRGWYVARFNTFEQQNSNSIVDMHVGYRGAEVYNNTIFNTNGYGYGIAPRGGANYFYNNTIYSVGTGIKLQFEEAEYPVNETYVWDNTFWDVTNEFVAAEEYEENVDYFLYEREGYQAYPYPHPLTLDGDLPPSWFYTSYNETTAGEPCLLSVYYDDDGTLADYAIEHNKTGETTWINGTFSTTPEWLNNTITLPSSGVVAWRAWALDDAGNWNRFCWQYITVTSGEPTESISGAIMVSYILNSIKELESTISAATLPSLLVNSASEFPTTINVMGNVILSFLVNGASAFPSAVSVATNLQVSAVEAAGVMSIFLIFGMVYVVLTGKDIMYAVFLAVGAVLMIITTLLLSQMSIVGG